jgi:uncharacterized protein YqjF (DUF2071 family)
MTSSSWLLPLAGHMRWRRVVLAHWPEREPAALVARLPDGVALDRHEGRAWISVVAFEAVGPAPWPLLARGLERLVTYRQLNVRTYVRSDRGPAIVLLETYVDRRIALLPRIAGMPYAYDGRLSVSLDGAAVRVARSGETVQGTTETAPLAPAEPGSLDAFLLERYWVHGETTGGRPYAVRVAHRPWVVVPARLRSTLRGAAELAHVAPSVPDIRLVTVAEPSPRRRLRVLRASR